ncbi:MAG: hypothetical protein GEV00_24095 [Actinophytocola sp.]|nr:hypothetical protein [Actinophytocola sp.]
MSGRDARSPRRAATALGVISVLSAALLAASGPPWRFVPMTGSTAIVAVALGLLAIAAGALRNAFLTALAGLLLCLAALVVLVQLATGADWVGGNASTLSLWLGLGVGLLAVAYATHAERRQS